MSDYGPALFIKRIDEKGIEKNEQDDLLNLVSEICKLIKIKDEDKNIASPEFYDYNNYEEKSLSLLIFVSDSYGMMPEDIQADQQEVDANRLLKIGKEIDKKFPKTYSYNSYYVEV